MGATRILSLSLLALLLRRRSRAAGHAHSRAAAPAPTTSTPNTTQHNMGRDADKPSEIPTDGWKDVLYRVKNEITEDNVSLIAAGVAFYGLMALAPAIAAMVSIYGLFVTPDAMQSQMQNLTRFMPADASQLVLDQVTRITSASQANLSIAAIGSLLLALLSAMKGSKALITAANITYDEQERRGFLKLNLAALGLTVGAVLFVIVALVLIAAFPVIIDHLPVPAGIQSILSLGRWPLLGLLLILGLAAFYRYAPNRSEPKWRWVSWGSVLGMVLWLVGSILFSLYVSNFASYNETYGSLGAVVVLLMWFYLSAFVVLLGAEVNSEMEHQTARDSTVGEEAPLGSRGAYVADTIGESRHAR